MCQLHSSSVYKQDCTVPYRSYHKATYLKLLDIPKNKKRIKEFTITAITEYVLKHQEYLSQLISIYIKLSYKNITERHKTVNNTYVSLQKA